VGAPHPPRAGGDDLAQGQSIHPGGTGGVVPGTLAGLDLRSIKPTLKLEVLRCKTPAMVRQEIGGHRLVYHLIPVPPWLRPP
jgi:hypothetical protein